MIWEERGERGLRERREGGGAAVDVSIRGKACSRAYITYAFSNRHYRCNSTEKAKQSKTKTLKTFAFSLLLTVLRKRLGKNQLFCLTVKKQKEETLSNPGEVNKKFNAKMSAHKANRISTEGDSEYEVFV